MSGALSSPGFDPAIALQAGRGIPAPPNPLQTIGQFAQVQNAINQNKLFPGQMELQNQDITRNTVQNAQMINRAAYASIAHLLDRPDGTITHQDWTNALASAENNLGLPTHGVINDMVQAMPGGDGPDFDRAARSIILARTQPPERAAGAVVPSAGTMNVGDQILPTRMAAPGMPGYGNPEQSGPGVSVGMSPSEVAAQVGRLATEDDVAKAAAQGITIHPGDSMTESMLTRLYGQGVGTMTRGGRRIPAGANPLVGPVPSTQGDNPLLPGTTAPPVGPNGQPLPAPVIVNVPGRGNQITPSFDPVTGQPLAGQTTPNPARPNPPGVRPIGPGNPGGALPAPVVVAPTVPGGAVLTGRAPETQDTITQNQQAYRAAQTQVAPMALNNTQFKEAHDAIANLAQATAGTGAGQAALNQARRILNQLGYPNSDTVNDAATAEKLLNAAIAAKAPRSDAQQQLAEHANPTLNMPAGASLPIIRQLVAGNRAQQLAVETAPDKQGNGFIAHNTEKSRTYNSPEGLAALSYDMTPGPQRAAYVENLKKMRDAGNPGPWNRFSETFKAAHESKVLAP